ncbi:hypothetical protein KIN20_006876 [Parelaphostrongylus tenuis]|uniref:Chitin-binding type-2 domain-containing protein n=1 Tax=Parelaphostrongylus tenuis TaxID=148309 RepID=A0AAD5MKQ7_PARTN|nr:hypothetical protein KIN20_006876 [Parelaphostrongylus tenuis]
MRLLLLLTLTGFTLGLASNNICVDQVNGVFATSNCSDSYSQCFNGKVVHKKCPVGLVFNPDDNQCDFAVNVNGCEAQRNMGCENRLDGNYGIGCSSSYFACSNGILYPGRCPHGLVYDEDRRMCDHKFRVLACGGHPEVEREPVVRSPYIVPTYAPHTLKSSTRRDLAGVVSRCQGEADGAHPIEQCGQQYAMCTHGAWKLAECDAGEVFKDGTCLPPWHSFRVYAAVCWDCRRGFNHSGLLNCQRWLLRSKMQFRLFLLQRWCAPNDEMPIFVGFRREECVL